MIERKKKKCKGTGKASGSGCGELSFLVRYGLCRKCFNDWLINTPAGKEMLSKTLKMAHKKEISEQRKLSRKEKEENKSIAQLIQEARKPFQQYIRMRDANDACISCGSTDSELWDAGHFYKAELYTGLIFNEINCNKQCRKCNTFLDGNENKYRIGMIEKWGEALVNNLDEISDEMRSYKFTRQELIGIKKHYQEKLKT